MKKELNKKIIEICEEAGTAAAAEKCGEYMDEIDREYDARMAQGMTEIEAYRDVLARVEEIRKLVDNLPKEESEEEAADRKAGHKNLKRIIDKVETIMWLVTIPLYVVGSMVTHSWKYSWLVFILVGVLQAVLDAVVDVNDGKKNPKKILRGAKSSILWGLATIVYFLVSFATNAWAVTWVIFLFTLIAQIIMDKNKD